jgi:hypothetical protein
MMKLTFASIFAVAAIAVPATVDAATNAAPLMCAYKASACQSHTSSQLGRKPQHYQLAQDRKPASCCNATVKTCC